MSKRRRKILTHEEAKVAIATQKLTQPDVFAHNIDGIARAMNVLIQSRLKMDTIVLLISEKSGVARWDVRLVLAAATSLDKLYLKDEKKK